MGIVDDELADVKLPGGKHVEIESNASGAVHLHIDDIRISCSVEEFEQLAQVVREGNDELKDLKERNNA